MNENQITEGLGEIMPLRLEALDLKTLDSGTGMVIVDEVNGFATVGGGNLAPQTPNEQVSTMVKETDRLARFFSNHDWPVLVFRYSGVLERLVGTSWRPCWTILGPRWVQDG